MHRDYSEILTVRIASREVARALRKHAKSRKQSINMAVNNSLVATLQDAGVLKREEEVV
jgi:hypothetical protein